MKNTTGWVSLSEIFCFEFSHQKNLNFEVGMGKSETEKLYCKGFSFSYPSRSLFFQEE